MCGTVPPQRSPWCFSASKIRGHREALVTTLPDCSSLGGLEQVASLPGTSLSQSLKITAFGATVTSGPSAGHPGRLPAGGSGNRMAGRGRCERGLRRVRQAQPRGQWGKKCPVSHHHLLHRRPRSGPSQDPPLSPHEAVQPAERPGGGGRGQSGVPDAAQEGFLLGPAGGLPDSAY